MSLLLVAKYFPSGVKAIDCTQLVCPVKVANSFCSSTLHSFTVLSALPDAKRRDRSFFIGNRVRTCISDDVEEAKAALRKSMASYWLLPNYRNYWKETGYADEMATAEKVVAEGRAADMPHYLTDRWLADCTLFGSAAHVREGVEAWRDAGVTTPIVVPISPDGNQKRAIEAVFKAFE